MADARDLEAGDRVRVREGVDVPAWATTGVVVKPRNRPSTSGDYYLHPLVRWDADGVERSVPDSWLIRLDDLESAHRDVLDALTRWDQAVARTLRENNRRTSEGLTRVRRGLVDLRSQVLPDSPPPDAGGGAVKGRRAPRTPERGTSGSSGDAP